jgi:hypothetical protein
MERGIQTLGMNGVEKATLVGDSCRERTFRSVSSSEGE